MVYAPSSPIVSAERSEEAVVRNHVRLQICSVRFSERSPTARSVEFGFTDASDSPASVSFSFTAVRVSSLARDQRGMNIGWGRELDSGPCWSALN